MNMYIAQVRDGALKVVENLGVVDPDEQVLEQGRFVQA
jgi:hypothetical protein